MTTQVQTSGTVNLFSMVGLAGLVAAFGFGMFSLMSEGHGSFNSGSDGISWGLPVVNYIYFVLVSAGLTMFASLALTFGSKAFYPIAKRCVWLSLVGLAAGFASLAMEIGHPFRMLWTLPFSFQYLSPLNWMGIFYAVFIVFGVMKFLRLHNEDWDSATSKKVGAVALVAELLAACTLAMAFGALAMRPMWFSPLVPVYFLLTALCSGGAVALLTCYLTYGDEQSMPAGVRNLVSGLLPTVLAAVLGVTIIIGAYQVVIGLWSNADGLQVWDHIVSTPWFWIEVAAMLGALYLLLQRKALMVAAGLILLGMFIHRYEFVVGGQMVPLMKGSWVPELIPYVPSLTEWSLTAMSFSIVAVGWAFGEKMLNLGAAPKQE